MTRHTSGNDADSSSATGQSVQSEPLDPRRLDETDRRILGVLTHDARTSVRSLAERLHLSRANAYARIKRLSDDGVIRSFGARVHPSRAGLNTSAYVALNIEQNTWRAVSAQLVRLPYVDTIALLGSEFDVLCQVHAPDNEALRQLVLERVQAIPGVLATRTWLAFEEMDGAGTPWPV